MGIEFISGNSILTEAEELLKSGRKTSISGYSSTMIIRLCADEAVDFCAVEARFVAETTF